MIFEIIHFLMENMIILGAKWWFTMEIMMIWVTPMLGYRSPDVTEATIFDRDRPRSPFKKTTGSNWNEKTMISPIYVYIFFYIMIML